MLRKAGKARRTQPRPVRVNDRESGQALVEFALLAPVLLAVLIGIFKCATTFNNYVVLTDAVRAGARQLAISRGAANPCGTAIAQVQSSASDLNTSNLTVQAEVSGSSSNCADLAAGNQQGDDATVKGTYPCDLTIFGINFAPGCKISSTMTERIE